MRSAVKCKYLKPHVHSSDIGLYKGSKDYWHCKGIVNSKDKVRDIETLMYVESMKLNYCVK